MVRNFRVDQIDGQSITLLRDPKLPHRCETFPAAKIWVQYDIEKILAKSIGVWNFKEDAKEEEVKIRFYGWAANHLMVFQVHPSQQLLHINEEEGYIDVKFSFYTYPQHVAISKPLVNFQRDGLAKGLWTAEQFPHVALFERYPEVGYLLGKYINFMHVLE
jgi:hypothetical protein